jgi:hypothetical protein
MIVFEPKQEVTEKVCSKCEESKSHRRFGWDKTRKQLKRVCKDCASQVQKDYVARHKDKIALQRQARNFNLSVEQLTEMYNRQDNKCAICGSEKGEFYHGLAVDHDHETGKVRALLCGPCNMGIGQLGDDPERLEAAAKYIRLHKRSTD